MRKRSFISGIVLVMLVLAVPSLWAQDGLRGALLRFESSAGLLQGRFAQKLVAADFDQDQEPDGALLLGGSLEHGAQAFRIELHVTAGENQELTFTSSERELALSVLDVNRDGIPDIVVEQAFTGKRVEIWLNDGRGSFHQANSEDYPPATQAPNNWSTRLALQDFLSAYLPSRSGSDDLALISAPVPSSGITDGMRFWHRMMWAQSGPHATNPSRGPPSLL